MFCVHRVWPPKKDWENTDFFKELSNFDILTKKEKKHELRRKHDFLGVFHNFKGRHMLCFYTLHLDYYQLSDEHEIL